MSTSITVGKLAEWIIDNRKGNAFKGDTFSEIVLGLQEDIKNNNMLYVEDDDNNIIGVVSFIPDKHSFILFVRNILITRHSALAIFAQHFKEHFEGYCIAGNRNNEYVQYNTHRLVTLLSKSKTERKD